MRPTLRSTLILLLINTPSEPGVSAQSLIIRNATIVSPERTEVVRGADIHIKDERIVAIGPHLSVPQNVPSIDASGRFVTPGLIDSHVHLYHATGLRRKYTQNYAMLRGAYLQQLPRSLLYHGFTTVIELNADAQVNAQFESRALHPRLFHCSQGLVLPDGFMSLEYPPGEFTREYPNFLHDRYGRATLPVGARADEHTPTAVIARIKRSGGICAKLYFEESLWSADSLHYALPSVAILREVAKAAHEAGIVTILHATSPRGYETALNAGIDIVAHGLWDVTDVPWDAPNLPEEVRALLARAAHEGLAMQPTTRTVRNTASLFDDSVLKDPRLAHVLPPAYLTYLRTDAQAQRADFLRAFGSTLPASTDAKSIADLQRKFGARLERSLGDLDSAGARLLLGTDTAVGGFGWGNPPGLNGLWEMEGWVRGGVSPRSVLEAATLRNAAAFGLSNNLGTIEVGKLADLLILETDPLESVSAFDRIEFVVLGGRAIARRDLSAMANR